MRRFILPILALLGIMTTATAQSSLDSIFQQLENAPVQEKVYLHLDNTCYYKGDTIWYKSYVVRADDLQYTDMSRILYVELVSPDGLVVQRQHHIISADGYGAGNFELKDSLYSGYYELRAYTRWMLNFCVTEHPFYRKDREQFYNRQMAQDFFRQYGTIYSRVVPVYERPESAGDYFSKYMLGRPKTRLDPEAKDRLTVTFYPEGGHLIAGTSNVVAFEAKDEEGQQVPIIGKMTVGGKTVQVKTTHHGRGTFTVNVPASGTLTAHFTYHEKNYQFDLPKAEAAGCALHVDATGDALSADVTLRGLPHNAPYAAVVLCRGALRYHQAITPGTDGHARITLPADQLPTGVNDLLILDGEGKPLADRLFFVNHHDYDLQPITMEGVKDSYEPFEPIHLTFQAPSDVRHISIAVRDGGTDDPTFDTGNMMTDLLLSSELKGFIAYPDYYFESDDQVHRQALDILMMVQGWRRYRYDDLVSKVPLRYEPEKSMTVEGHVYKTIPFDEIRPCEVSYWLQGIFGYCSGDEEHDDPNDPNNLKNQIAEAEEGEGTSFDGSIAMETLGAESQTVDPTSAVDPHYGINHRGLKKEVTIESELVLLNDIANLEMETTDGGHFVFNVPPYYGNGILFLSAHDIGISENKQKRISMRGRLDEDSWPEYYVKRDLFYPIFAKKYDYYQCHQPEPVNTTGEENGDIAISPSERLSSMDRTLKGIEVKTRRRRSLHDIDYSKPAYVYDAYELYNLATDYGLSYGKLNFRRFPMQVTMLLLGNYNSERSFNLDGRMNDNLFYRSYTPDDPFGVRTLQMQSNYAIAKDLQLKRQDKIRLFTDFELRNEDTPKEQALMLADVTLDFVTIPNDGMRHTYRDRRIILHGFDIPDEFYHPDYSQTPLPSDLKDYRRTLYWNPNATTDADGRVSTTFYNNGKVTRIRVSTAGALGKKP